MIGRRRPNAARNPRLAPFVHYLGDPDSIGHHAAPLRRRLEVSVAPSDQVIRQARPGDVAVLCSEHFETHREAVGELRRRRVATVYAIDGILEWRNAWENAPDERACPWTMRPCLADKVAVIGPSQARVLAAWGNADRLELVGVPRFDDLVARRPDPTATLERIRDAKVLRVLVMTAKTPGFTPEQIETTARSLADLRDYFSAAAANGSAERPRFEVSWRLTAGLEERLGVRNALDDLTGNDLAARLGRADLVVTTPSTAMLEAMLLGKPVALLDYHGVPSLVPAAWQITDADRIAPTLESMTLRDASGSRRWAWQQALLDDALWSRPDATDRMADLLIELHREALERIATGAPWEFTRRMLPVIAGGEGSYPAGPGLPFATLYPDHPDLGRDELGALRSELAQARRELAYVRSHLDQAHAVLDRWQRLPLVGSGLSLVRRWTLWRRRRAMPKPDASSAVDVAPKTGIATTGGSR